MSPNGNRREPIFFEDGDQAVYRDLPAEQCARRGVACWSWRLMRNHVHPLVVPPREDMLGLAVGEAHRRYTSFINARGRCTGHLFQSRLASVAMDETHLMAAFRYRALNPVRAKLVAQAPDWPWSSARAHIAGADDGMVEVRPLLERVADVGALFATAEADATAFKALRLSEGTGRPLGNADFVAGLERPLGRPIARRAPGRKPAEPGREQPALF